MATVTDTVKSTTDCGIDTQTINNGAEHAGSELDRGAATIVGGTVTALVTITGFASAPSAGGYVSVRLAPLTGTAGTLHDDQVGAGIIPVTADALYTAEVPLAWPGARYLKPVIANESGQNTDADAVSLEMHYQAVTL